MRSTNLHFVTFENATDFKSRTKRKAARSHINKQNLDRRKGSFRNTYFDAVVKSGHGDTARPSAVASASTEITRAINVELLDPFETLPVNQFSLQSLLYHRKLVLYYDYCISESKSASAQQAVEPVFSISAPFSFHDLHGAYSNSFADPAFSNALMCAILLVKHEYSFAPDVLYYQGLAIKNINRQLGQSASDECTIGAILLLIGVKWRTRSDDEAQIHLRGLEQFLKICQARNQTLSASVRRGIFWQDVNVAIVSARDRVMDRATFPEFLWDRATFMVDWAFLPLGFEDVRSELGGIDPDPMWDIYVLLKDVYVLQKHGEAVACNRPDVGLIHDIDNMQACIEARLIEQLQTHKDNRLRATVMLTVYLYAYSLFTQIWNGSAIPQYIASRLLKQLESLCEGPLEKSRKYVLLWCTITAGCLIPPGPVRSSYVDLLKLRFEDVSSASSINAAWFTTSGVLDRYLWSQTIFGPRALALIKEIYATN